MPEQIRPRNAYDRQRVQQPVGERSRTKQAPKESCDINRIIARYRATGQLPHITRQPPTYGDFSQAQSLHEAMETVAEAEAEFMALPAKIRTYCDNDPRKFLQHLAEEDNREHLECMGLILPEEPDEPDPEPAPEEPPA